MHMSQVNGELFRAMAECILDTMSAFKALSAKMAKIPQVENFELDFNAVVVPPADYKKVFFVSK